MITSQIDTAPKLVGLSIFHAVSLITSQIDTAPKPIGPNSPLLRTFKSDRTTSLTLNKMLVNKPFRFMLIVESIVFVLKKQNFCFLEIHLLEKEFEISF